MAKGRHQKKRQFRPVRLIAAVFAVVFLISAGMTASQLVEERREADAFQALADRVQSQPSTTEPVMQPSNDQSTAQTTEDVKPDIPTQNMTQQPQPEQEFNKYDELAAENPDMFGWVYIEGTKINYPVMYTPDDPEHYLHRAFDGSKASGGVPFMDGNCEVGCNNYIIYGHHMKNGSMFAGLLDYADEEFWKEHPYVQFDTIDEPGTYEVMAAFYSKAYLVTDKNVFRYYQYIDLTVEPVFDDFIANVKKSAIYDTDVDAKFGDQMLTLSTCSYNTTNGRFVVVAKRVRDTYQQGEDKQEVAGRENILLS